jgi:DNA-binding IclR family transcriptional regulator
MCCPRRGQPVSARERPVSTLRSLERALAILTTFDRQTPVLSIHDIAARTGLPRPSVYRFLSTLVARGFLVELDAHGQRRYAIGPAILALARSEPGSSEVRRRAYPVMQSLSAKTGESVYLTARRGAEGICIESVEVEMPLRVSFDIGHSIPLHAGGARAILAFLPPETRDRLIDGMTFQRLTSRTIRSRPALLRRLAVVQRRGYEISRGEITSGIVAISAPLLDEAGDAFAVLTVAAPEARTSRRQEALTVDAVMKSAHEIMMRLRS